jgi:hypothetical protein
MADLGNDDPCHCGSGLKFGRCHGSITDPLTSPGNLPLDATQANLGVMGFPGQHQHIHIINRFKDGDPRNAIPASGGEGLYEVVFVLHRPGYQLMPEGRFSFSSGLEGDSHLAISKPAFSPPGNPDAAQIKIFATNDDGYFEFTGFPNKNGYLGKVQSAPFQAPNRIKAEEMAYRALLPSFSEMSLHLDIPMEIYQRETIELRTSNVQASIVTPQIPAPMAINPTSTSTADFRGVASLYREAMNSNSPVFAFLCLYKIIEMLRARRKKVERLAKQLGNSYSPPTEILPVDLNDIRAWVTKLFYTRPAWDLMALESAVPPEFRGKPIAEVVNDALNPLRINVAHGLFSKKGDLELSADELLHSQSVTRVLPLTKCIVRRMLKTDFASSFLSHIRD